MMDGKVADLIRIVFYLWAVWEFSFLTALYQQAYKEMKRSRVIGGVALLTGAMAMLFSYMVLVAYLNSRHPDLYFLVRQLLVVPVIGAAFAARFFRIASLESPTKIIRKDLKAPCKVDRSKLSK